MTASFFFLMKQPHCTTDKLERTGILREFNWRRLTRSAGPPARIRRLGFTTSVLITRLHPSFLFSPLLWRRVRFYQSKKRTVMNGTTLGIHRRPKSPIKAEIHAFLKGCAKIIVSFTFANLEHL